jgi:hypothetical protein
MSIEDPDNGHRHSFPSESMYASQNCLTLDLRKLCFHSRLDT